MDAILALQNIIIPNIYFLMSIFYFNFLGRKKLL